MISGILDNDLYKFTMQQAVVVLYPEVEAEYTFINRGKTEFPKGFDGRLYLEIRKMEDFKLDLRQKAFLEENCKYLTPEYLAFLSNYKFDLEQVMVTQSGTDLEILIRGPWQETILWEVPLMAMISELYFKMTKHKLMPEWFQRKQNKEKVKRLRDHGIQFADFGTRRRYSECNQRVLLHEIQCLNEENTLIGTSNVHFAAINGITPRGTQGHEWIMFHAIQHGYRGANRAALDMWIGVYGKDLGIALTDTFTTDEFLRTFTGWHAMQVDGVRQDSGDPLEFVDKIIRHYEKLEIDPKTKTIVFSDGLDVDKVIEIHEHCAGRIKDYYGIGTNLTNDVGATPLNMVIKLSRCKIEDKWHNVIKLSDSPGKHTGDKKEIENCLTILKEKR